MVVRSRAAEHNQVLEAVLSSPLEKAMKMAPKIKKDCEAFRTEFCR